jgi:hypothetical protein
MAGWFSNSDMSYDTKNQKNRPEPLEKGAALSTVFFVEEPEVENEKAKADDQPPSKSNENDAD